jgi:hypothetical protein
MVLRVIGVRENAGGRVSHYKLENGKIYTIEKAIKMWQKRLLPRYNKYVKVFIRHSKGRG